MANNVFANGREIACKSGSGKTIAAFPDTCFTPPENPATPPGVPIPYPVTGFDADTTDGTKSVKISGKEIMEKNESFFKKVVGDDAAQTAKKGVITSVIQGKLYFKSWSMDVKFDGVNVVRHLDLTTLNHASDPGQTPPWNFFDSSIVASMDEKCKEESEKTQKCAEKHIKKKTHQDKRKEFKKPGVTQKAAVENDANVDWDALLKADGGKKEFYNKAGATQSMCEDPDCKGQFDCNLVPFDFGCCGDKTPHHVVPAHCFLPSGERAAGDGKRYPGLESYDDTKAPCICLDGATKSSLDGNGKTKEHGRVHEIADAAEDKFMKVEELSTPTGKPKMKGGERAIKKTAGSWSFQEANEKGCDAVTQVKQGCDKECMKKQSEAGHKQMGLDVGEGKSDKLMLRADSTGNRTPPNFVPGGSTSTTPPPSGLT